MRVLVTGVKGQLGHDVVNEMEKRGLTPVGVDLAEMDITDKEACDRCDYGGKCRGGHPLCRLYSG